MTSDAVGAPAAAGAALSDSASASPTDVHGESGAAIERSLLRVWREVLAAPQMGAADSFFDLGGDSLLATRLVARIRAELGYEVSLATLFRRPTASALAHEIARADSANSADTPAPHRRATRARNVDLPVSFNQEERLLCDLVDEVRKPRNLLISLRLLGSLDVVAVEEALNGLVARHEALRARFSVDRKRAVQRVCPPQPAQLERFDIDAPSSEESQASARRKAQIFALQPLDPYSGELLRGALIRTAPKDHVCVVVVDQLGADGWSLKLMAEELAHRYDGLVLGREPELTPLRVQFPDFARWERELLSGERLERLMTFWRSQLPTGPIPIVELPFRMSPGREGRDSVALTLSTEVTGALRTFAASEGMTLFVLAVTALKAAVRRLSPESAVAVFTHAANRRSLEVEPVVGWFANRVVLRTELPGDLTLREAARRVRDSVVRAQAHQELPFPLLLQLAYPDRFTRPLDAPYLRVQHDPSKAAMRGLRMSGLRVEPFAIAAGTSDAMLVFEMIDSGQELELHISTDRARFDTSDARRFLGDLGTVMSELAADPDRALRGLS